MGLSTGSKRLLAAGATLGALAIANRLAAPRHPRPLARHRFVQVKGVRLHYIEQGSGTPVVLLHGNGAMAEDFVASGVLGRLATRHRVIAFDRPGFGYSERPGMRPWTFAMQAELLLAAMRALGIGRAAVVGHSAGSLAALTMGLHDPAAIGGLVLLSGFYFPQMRADMLATSMFALPVLRQISGFAVAHLFGWLGLPAYLRVIFAPNPVTHEFLHRVPLAATMRPGHVRATIADTPLLALGAARLPRQWQRLDMPVTIMTGSDDRIVTSRLQSERLHRCIAGSRLVTIAGAGHMLHHAAPDRVTQEIETVLRSPQLQDAESLAADAG